MQVLQFKTVHLAVIGAIASAFGMAAGNVNAEPLLTYESNKVVDGALSDAIVGTQGKAFYPRIKQLKLTQVRIPQPISCLLSIKTQERIRWFTLRVTAVH